MMPRITIIDSKIGNVGSVKNALDLLGFENIISRDPAKLNNSSHIILPGVGSFPSAAANLKKLGLLQKLGLLVKKKKVKFLGICLGMQLLADFGEEGEKTQGLGFIRGITRKFNLEEDTFRLPHVGWNNVSKTKKSLLLKGVKNSTFYFVHSFHFVPNNRDFIKGTTVYGEKFASVVEHENIFGVQFHPEKSQSSGLRLLENFCLL